jgi:hypothetical protein
MTSTPPPVDPRELATTFRCEFVDTDPSVEARVWRPALSELGMAIVATRRASCVPWRDPPRLEGGLSVFSGRDGELQALGRVEACDDACWSCAFEGDGDGEDGQRVLVDLKFYD